MQHLISNYREEDVADEAEAEDLLQLDFVQHHGSDRARVFDFIGAVSIHADLLASSVNSPENIVLRKRPLFGMPERHHYERRIRVGNHCRYALRIEVPRALSFNLESTERTN